MLRSKLVLLLTALLPGAGTVQAGPLQNLAKLQRYTNAGLLETLREIARPLRLLDCWLINLNQFLRLYAQHGGHYAVHVQALREREGWR